MRVTTYRRRKLICSAFTCFLWLCLMWADGVPGEKEGMLKQDISSNLAPVNCCICCLSHHQHPIFFAYAKLLRTLRINCLIDLSSTRCRAIAGAFRDLNWKPGPMVRYALSKTEEGKRSLFSPMKIMIRLDRIDKYIGLQAYEHFRCYERNRKYRIEASPFPSDC